MNRTEQNIEPVKKSEKSQKKSVMKKVKVPEPEPEPVPEPEPESEDEVEVEVEEVVIDGAKYYKDDGTLYDPETSEEVGKLVDGEIVKKQLEEQQILTRAQKNYCLDDPLLNAKKQLEEQQILTRAQKNYCLVYKLRLDSIRITLERARKTFMEVKSKETDMLYRMENETKVLLRLQHNVD